MPRVLPTSPLALVFFAYRVWRRLPPSQRRRVVAAAVVYGPQVAARARLLRRSRTGSGPVRGAGGRH